MLEGLEISEVMLSEIDLSDRCDAEYFGKIDLKIEEKLKQINSVEIRNFGTFVASAFYPAATQLYEIGDTPFIRCVDCINFPFITKEQDSLFEKIPIEFVDENTGINFLHKEDIVISKVGTPCYASILFEHNTVALSRTVLGMKNIKKINPFYLLIFLRSKYGFSQLQRERELTIQYQLTLERVKRTLVFVPSVEFQQIIKNITIKYIECLNKSKRVYRQAEELLLEAIGLKDFKLSEKGINIKSLKKSFLATGRLDAEYYQLKYEEIIARVKKQPHDVLDNLVKIKKSIEPGSDVYSDEGLPFIRVSDYNKFGILKPEKCLSNNFCIENDVSLQLLYPKKETILFSKDGSVGIAYMVLNDMKAVTSGAILHLKVKNKAKVLPLYLTLVLNSKVVQQQAERDAGGSIILHWRLNDIKKVIIPIVDYSIQQQIEKLIKQSFSLRAESEHLLDEAKNMVEREIEGGN